MKINSVMSQLVGVVLSISLGIEIVYVSSWFFHEEFYFHQQVASFVGAVLGISIGGIVAFNAFTKHQRDVPQDHEGTLFFLGKRTGIKCSEGRYWIPVLCEIRTINLGKSTFMPTALKVDISKDMSNLVRIIMITIAIIMGINAATPTRGKKNTLVYKPNRGVPECDITRATHLHTLHVQADGSTEAVSVPDGKNVCFEASFWNNLNRLGYKTGVGSKKKLRLYTCTREGVISGTCRERVGNIFQFTPQKGVILPRYWFTAS